MGFPSRINDLWAINLLLSTFEAYPISMCRVQTKQHDIHRLEEVPSFASLPSQPNNIQCEGDLRIWSP